MHINLVYDYYAHTICIGICMFNLVPWLFLSHLGITDLDNVCVGCVTGSTGQLFEAVTYSAT